MLGRKSHPVEKNKDIIALGTYSTVSAWSRAQFKSGDGTFRMTVKSFYQVKNIFNEIFLFSSSGSFVILEMFLTLLFLLEITMTKHLVNI